MLYPFFLSFFCREMATMCKIMPLFFIFSFFLVALSGATQESVELLTLGGSSSTPEASMAAVLPNEQLKAVSASVLTAEKWTRTSILANYPAINITAIVVGHNLLCVEGQQHSFTLILPTLRNIHYSLTRWGLHKQIKVSVSFSSTCLHLDSETTFRDDIADSHIKPLLSFLQEIDSIYLVNPVSASKALISLVSHSKALKNLGFSNLTKIDFIILEESQSIGRKLSSIVHSDPFSPVASPDPATSATLPPLAGGKISPSPLFSPPFGLHLPPCSNPSIGGPSPAPAAAPPVIGMRSELWCVAKPNVPQETLQEAMDYACGDGGADCAAITPQGSCYYPNTVVAHASFAFNSYWQKTKNNGGTCGFGGTAMLISSDPSYRHCRFVLT